MKKYIFAAFIALANMIFFPATQSPAQDSGHAAISAPAEIDAYKVANAQSDPMAKAEALQVFLKRYPQSAFRNAALEQLIDANQKAHDLGETPSVDDHLLQLNPNDPKDIFISVFIKTNMCGRTYDAKICDDAAEMALKGLTALKPPGTSDDDWKKLTADMYPVYHSAIALDNMVSKKDVKMAIQEYRTELMLYSAVDTTKGRGLVDTLQLAEAYTKPDARDLFMACWLYARSWNFALATYQAEIELKLEYWYKRYHGSLEGLDELKAKARTTLFPPSDISKIVKQLPSLQTRNQ